MRPRERPRQRISTRGRESPHFVTANARTNLMSSLRRPFPRAELSLAIAAALLLPMGRAHARDLDGTAHTVAATDTPEAWRLVNGAILTLDPGASALGIVVDRSQLIMLPSANGEVIAINASANALQIVDASTASISDARIVSTGRRGIEIIGGSATALPGNITV